MFSLQSKYEELLEGKQAEVEQLQTQHKQDLGKLNFEIDYLRKETTELMKGQNGCPQLSDAVMPAEELPFRISGQSNMKPMSPSPYVQAFMKSNFK